MPQNAESLTCRSNHANQSEPGFLKEVKTLLIQRISLVFLITKKEDYFKLFLQLVL